MGVGVGWGGGVLMIEWRENFSNKWGVSIKGRMENQEIM